MKKTIVRLIAVVFLGFSEFTFGQGTAFTYQGRLNNGVNPANGAYDISCALYDALSGGTQQGSAVTNAATSVSNGLFTVTLDFGNQFPGGGRWLEIGVRTNGGGSFSTLTPRQQLASTPYAIQAANASTAGVATSASSVAAGNIVGTLTTAQLPPGLVTNGASGLNLTGSFSGNASGLTNLNASNVSGVLAPAQIPNLDASKITTGTLLDARLSANVALLNGTNLYSGTNRFSGVVIATNPANQISGIFSGNGGALTNVPGTFPQQLAPGTNLTAQVNRVYNLTNSELVTVTLPTNANVGDMIQINALGSAGWGAQLEGAPIEPAGLKWTSRGISNNWQSLAMSADGTKMFAAPSNGTIYTSSDRGITWATAGNSPTGLWTSVACSVDGIKVAGTRSGRVFTSNNGGTNWSQSTFGSFDPFVFKAVALSADGSRLVAVGYNDSFAFASMIIYSTDGGASWSVRTNAPTSGWKCVAMSADGSRVLVAAGGFYVGGSLTSPLWISTNSGINWSAAPGPTAGWNSVASSADGAKLSAVSSFCYTSDDFGASWVARTNGLPAGPYTSVACSSDGTRLVLGGFQTQLYTSTDGGLTWTGHGPTNYWKAVASSSDAITLVAGPDLGQLHTSFGAIAIPFEGSQSTSSELRYTANGQWEAVRLPDSTGNSPNTLVSRDESGNFSAGTITANSFVGNGSGLTALGAGNVIGVLGTANIPNLDASKITTGALSDARLATISTAGKVADTALSANIALRAGGNTFTGHQSVTSGNLGIGMTTPNFPLTFLSTLGDKISVYESGGGNHYGFGVQSFQLQIHSDTPAADIVFGSGQSTNLTETMRIKGSGNVGIGTANPNANTLQINTNFHSSSGYALTASRADFGVNIQINRTNGQGGIGLVVDNSGNGDASTQVLLVRNNAGTSPQTLLNVRADGNVAIGPITPTNKLHVAGGVSATAFVTTSDRNAKENFAPVSAQDVLSKVASLPITTWNFKDMKDGRHMGPMAQDFYAAFHLGGGETTITSMDPDGVALAAIQGLNQKLDETRSELKRRDAENAELRQRLERLEKALREKSVRSGN